MKPINNISSGEFFALEKQVGLKIRALRVKHGMSQGVLSERMRVLGCDVSRVTVAKIELGKRHIYITELKALRAIFNLSYSELLD